MASVYTINKGINRSIEFRGLRAQYIWYLGIGLVLLLIVFTVLYIAGINVLVCLSVIGLLGSLLTYWVYKLSKQHGRYGLMKKMARSRVPKAIRCNSRRMFYSNSKCD